MGRASLRSVLLLGLVVVACGGGQKPPPPKPAAQPSAWCPELQRPELVGTYDFAHEYVLSRDAGDKLKAAALASIEVSVLDSKLDGELGLSCTQIATGLGDKGSYGSASEACTAAVKAVKDARTKLGPKATVQLVVREPVCQVDTSLLTKCAAICDSSVPPERVKVECEQKAGRCDGQCDGLCEAKTDQKCDGVCSGSCEGPVKGTCGGRCKGTCDGRPANGSCAGTCAGTCIGGAYIGECKGACRGSCRFAKKAICADLCAGKCSVEVSDPKCAGDFKSPDVSTDCRARCELGAMNKAQCSQPQVGLVVASAKDRATEDALRAAVEKAYPLLLKVIYEVGREGPKRVHNAEAVISGTRTGFKDLALSGGKASAGASEAQLVKCFDEPFKKSAASAGSLKALLDQAIGLRDEVSK